MGSRPLFWRMKDPSRTVHDLSPALKRVRDALALTAAAFLSACSADSTTPVPAGPTLVIVAQPTTTDTIQARPSQPLVLEIRGVDGQPQPHVVLQFTALPSNDPKRVHEDTATVARVSDPSRYARFLIDTSDAQGRVKVLVGFGTAAGLGGLEMSVPQLGILDTFALNVRPGAPALIQFSVRDTLVSIGERFHLGASAADRVGNLISIADEPVTLTAASPILSVAAGDVTAGAYGRGYVVARAGSLVDTARVSITGRVVWRSQGGILITSVDGTDTTMFLRSSNLPASAYPAYPHAAPGGQLVAFHSGGPNSTIFVASASDVRLVASADSPGFPRWSADGQWIYFTTKRNDGIGVSRMHADGSSVQQIGPAFGGAAYDAVGISPDGQTVVIQDGSSLALIDVTSGAVRRLPISCSWPQFSPDGGRIACIATDFTVHVFNADGSNERVVGTHQVEIIGGLDWSPDGTRLLVVGQGAIFEPTELIDVSDGSSVRRFLSYGVPGVRPQVAFVP